MLFEPIKIGSMELRNRIVMPAIHHSFTPDGFVNEKLINYYWARGAGGAALITVGGCSIDKIGGAPFMVGLYDDKFIAGLKSLTKAVKSTGAKIAAQMYQAGRYAHSAFTGEQALAPSAVASRFTKETPKEMTKEDIQMVIGSFFAAARRAQEAGFDAVEIISSAGYLICQFLSPVTNLRTDEYGGSFENRSRFGLEVVEKVREAVGPAYPVLVRLSGHDFIPGSNTNTEAACFATALEQASVDCISVTGGWHETRVPQITGELPRGAYAYLARGVKEAVTIPVIASNRINDPAVAEQILQEGLADLINMGRPLIADPELPRKAAAGDYASIRRCIACNQGCMDAIFSIQEVHCAINPLAGREHEITITPATKSKKILVVGGGLAGLEAACTATERGHQVTLWEKEPRLGGQLHYAARPTGKSEFITLLDYYQQQLEKLGVKTVLDREAKATDIVDFGADEVIMATGAIPAPPPFSVTAPDKCITAVAALEGVPLTGRKIVVIGGGAVGCETAVSLAEIGTLDAQILKFLMENEAEELETLRRLLNRGIKEVTLVEMFKGVGRDIGISTRWVVMQHLRRLGVNIMDETKVVEVNEEGVLVDKDGEETLLFADTVVLAVGAASVNKLAAELTGLNSNLHIIGDALKPRKITEAIREGFDLALTL